MKTQTLKNADKWFYTWCSNISQKPIHSILQSGPLLRWSKITLQSSRGMPVGSCSTTKQTFLTQL